MTHDTRPTVSPIEGQYAMLRCEEVCGPLYRNIEITVDGDRESHGFVSDLADMQWDDNGKSEDSDKYDIIATISPSSLAFAIEVENMPAVDLKSEYPDEKPGVWVDSDDFAAYKALIPLADAACDYADSHCRWFDISTAPKLDRVFVSGIQPAHKTVASYRWVHEDHTDNHGKPMDHPNADRWRPLPPPPSTDPLPAVFTQLGQALEKIKEGK